MPKSDFAAVVMVGADWDCITIFVSGGNGVMDLDLVLTPVPLPSTERWSRTTPPDLRPS